MLWLVPSRADTQDRAPVAHLVNGRRHLRQYRRMPEGIAHDQSPDLHAACHLGQGRQHSPAFPNSPGAAHQDYDRRNGQEARYYQNHPPQPAARPTGSNHTNACCSRGRSPGKPSAQSSRLAQSNQTTRAFKTRRGANISENKSTTRDCRGLVLFRRCNLVFRVLLMTKKAVTAATPATATAG